MSVRLERAGTIATIVLDRPKARNALTVEMGDEVERLTRELREDASVRAVILRGEGETFCAGGDLNWLKRMVGYTFEENLEDVSALARMLRTIRECPKPVIARVHGAAYGGGVGRGATSS